MNIKYWININDVDFCTMGMGVPHVYDNLDAQPDAFTKAQQKSNKNQSN